MTERSKRITTFIFLLSLFVFLAVIMVVWSYNYYKYGTTQTKERTMPLVKCSSYAYRVIDNSLNYSNNTLKIKIEYIGEGGERFSKLEVIVDGNKSLSEEINPALRSPTIIVNNVKIKDSFLITPEGCILYNTKNCSLSQQKCVI